MTEFETGIKIHQKEAIRVLRQVCIRFRALEYGKGRTEKLVALHVEVRGLPWLDSRADMCLWAYLP